MSFITGFRLDLGFVSDISCKATFKGGCKQYEKLKLKRFGNRPYSVNECFALCDDNENCGGFFLHNEKKFCILYKEGCTKTAGDQFTYYSMKDCKGEHYH